MPLLPSRRRATRLAVLLFALCARAGGAQAIAPADPARPSPGAIPTLAPVPASGRQAVLVAIPSFGRYAFTATSRLGARLELVDRMAGSLGSSGEAGSGDGRLDLFLDRGEYQLLVESPEPKGATPATGRDPKTATVTVALQVTPAAERNDWPGPVLVETKPVATQLGDHEQRSYWLEIAEARPVFLEAAGRHLADLRLWRDGGWLEDAAPNCSQRQPIVGQPLFHCALDTRLEAGLYRLTAYGDAGQAWAEQSDDRPLTLRWGLLPLPAAGRQRLVMGPFGSERFRVAAATNFFRLELPGAGEATLGTGAIASQPPFVSGEQSRVRITKQTRPFWAEFVAPEAMVIAPESADESYEEESYDEESYHEESGDEEYDGADYEESGEEESYSAETDAEAPAAPTERWLEVSAAPGQVYVIQQFEQRDVYTFERSGRYWLSTVHTGQPGDDLDATAVLTSAVTSNGRTRETIVSNAAVPISRRQPWARRFNLLEDATLFLNVTDAGRYQVVAKGVAARFRIEPFFTSIPEKYQTPPWRGDGESWDLPVGLHVLSIDADQQGILDLGVRPAGLFADLLDLVGLQAPSPAVAGRGEARFGEVALEAGRVYTLRRNQQPGVSAGVVLRELPLDLAEALPLAVRPEEEVEIPFVTTEPGVLRAQSELGADLPLIVDGGDPTPQPAVAAGVHTVAVSNPGTRTAAASLQWQPDRLLAGTPEPVLPAESLASLPRFAELRPGEPSHWDLARDGTQTFSVQARRPALHALASTGLLATSGNLRTRTVTSLRRAEQNGVGRNFSIQEYLGVGEYQLTVSAQGRSAGHLGVTLQETPLRSGGELRPGVAARATLQAGEGLVYQIEIAKAGEYRLRAAGAGFVFAIRLEDGDGWPIEVPGIAAELERHFHAGRYRLVLLPRDVVARSLVTLERLEQPRRGEGHGPITLALGVPHDHLWREPEATAASGQQGGQPGNQPGSQPGGQPGDQRQPDLYRFTLPAAATVTIALDGEMQARLTGSGGEAHAMPPGRAWSGRLEAGAYELSALCSRTNNLVNYRVSVTPVELVAGTTRSLSIPGELPISVGSEGLIEIASLARIPVRATLYDASRRAVHRAAARPDDWNFLLTERLAPGNYRLAIEPLREPSSGTSDGRRRPTPEASASESRVISISMRAPSELAVPAVKLPWRTQLQPGDDVRIVPLQLPAGAELLSVRASADENIGCALETEQDGHWRSLADAIGRAPELLLALDPEQPAPLRLRLWSLDRRALPLRLEVAANRVSHVNEARLRAGTALDSVAGANSLQAALVDLDRPGAFRPAPGAHLRWATAPLTELVEVSGDGLASVLVASTRRLWVASAGSSTARAERVWLADDHGAALKLRLPATGRAIVDLGTAASGSGVGRDRGRRSGAREIVLLVATSLDTQPGVETASGENARPAGRTGDLSGDLEGAPPASHSMAAGNTGENQQGIATVALDGTATQAVVWNAAGAGSAEVELAPRRFAVPPIQDASASGLDGWCEPNGARAVRLPPGPKRIRVALGADLVAVLANGNAVSSVHWQGGMEFEETLHSTAAELYVLNSGGARRPYRVELQAQTAPVALSTARPYQQSFHRAGRERLTLVLPDNAGNGGGTGNVWELHLRGEGTTMTFLEEGGRVARGNDLQLRRPGTLLLDHGANSTLVWLDSAAAPGPIWTAAAIRGHDLRVNTGAVSLPLEGSAVRLRLPAGAAWQIETAAASITVLRRAGHARPEVGVHPNGTHLDLLGGATGEAGAHPDGARLDPPEGATVAELEIYPLGAGNFTGTLTVTPMAIGTLTEGIGLPVLLPAGARRYFSFELTEARRLGIGVRAKTSAVEAELYDQGGRLLQHGVVAVADLAAGRYFLALVLPAGATTPAAASPVIVGLAAPSTGPPDEVIREYLRDAAKDAETPDANEGLAGSGR